MAQNIVPARSKKVAHYNPQKGLKRIAHAEVDEKHFARAKDFEALEKAVRIKLTEQRKFVLWWDGPGKGDLPKGGGDKRSANHRDRPVTVKAGTNGLPSRKVIERWRKALAEMRAFERTYADAVQRCVAICEIGGASKRGTVGTGENEWFTPPEYIDAAREVLGGIDLDPASNKQAQEFIGAAEFFTKSDNGLTKDWHGTVWLNPPYAQPLIDEFVTKLVEEVKAGHISSAIMLTHNYTDTAWFHLAASCCAAICFTRGRVKFHDQEGDVAAPTQGQAFFYYGSDVANFAERFSGIGFVVVRWEP